MTTPRSEFLSRTECEAMKGLAILCVMMHNACHLLAGSVQENEFDFDLNNGLNLLEYLHHPDVYLPVFLFTIIGIGVHVFTFLSGYGLVKKYERPGVRVRTLPFIGYRYLKLLRLMLIPLIVYHGIYYYFNHSMIAGWDTIAAQLLTVVNLLWWPDPGVAIHPGPFWFFGMIMEMYVIYRLLLYRPHGASTASRVWPVVALIAAAWLAQTVCDPGGELVHYMRFNFVYGALPFGLGVLAGRYRGKLQLPWWALLLVLLGGLALTVAGNFTPYLWVWVPALVAVSMVAFIKLCHASIVKGAAWIGKLSAMLFVVHPVVRMLLFNNGNAVWASGVYKTLAIYFVAAFVVAWLYRLLLRWLPDVKIKID